MTQAACDTYKVGHSGTKWWLRDHGEPEQKGAIDPPEGRNQHLDKQGIGETLELVRTKTGTSLWVEQGAYVNCGH